MSISQNSKILASDASSLIKGLSISGKTITYTKVDGTTGTLTTQDTNTDTKVKQTVTTTDAEYSVLITDNAAPTTTITDTARYSTGVTVNPSTQRITAKGLKSPALGATYVGTAQENGAIIDTSVSSGTYLGIERYPGTSGVFTHYGYKNAFGWKYFTQDAVDASTNTSAETLEWSSTGLLTSSGGFKGSLTGNATTATTLATARTIRTNLASTSTASFNGSANITPGVTGVLPLANGGTGSSTKNFVDLSSAQTIAGIKTFSGTPVFPSTISMNDGSATRTVMTMNYDGSTTYGSELIIGAGGNVYIGSGESHTGMYNLNGASSTEVMYVCSDTKIVFYTNCQTPSSAKTFEFTADGKIVTPTGSIWIA